MRAFIALLTLLSAIALPTVQAAGRVDLSISSDEIVDALIESNVAHIQLDLEATQRLYDVTESNYGKMLYLYIDDKLEEVFTIVVGVESGVLRVSRPSASLTEQLRSLPPRGD